MTIHFPSSPNLVSIEEILFVDHACMFTFENLFLTIYIMKSYVLDANKR